MYPYTQVDHTHTHMLGGKRERLRNVTINSPPNTESQLPGLEEDKRERGGGGGGDNELGQTPECSDEGSRVIRCQGLSVMLMK